MRSCAESAYQPYADEYIIEVSICRLLHMDILMCIWLICRLCTTPHTKCCGAVLSVVSGHCNGYGHARISLIGGIVVRRSLMKMSSDAWAQRNGVLR